MGHLEGFNSFTVKHVMYVPVGEFCSVLIELQVSASILDGRLVASGWILCKFFMIVLLRVYGWFVAYLQVMSGVCLRVL